MCETKELCRTQQCGDDDHAAATASCEGCLKAGRVLLIFSSAPLDLPSPPEHHCSPSLKNDMKPLTLLLGFTALLHSLIGAASFDSGIINGKKAQGNSLSYMASIQMNGKHKCGGFLVKNNFVMTAAHCNVSGEGLTVVLGSHNLNEVQDSQRFSVASITRHNKYTSKLLQNDIMLLQLKTPVKLNKKMKLATLPKKEKLLKKGTKCIVAGWGATKTEKPSTTNLQVVDVTVVDKEECKNIWNKFETQITANMICAGGYETDKGACQGDSGGPLMCSGVATGIVSFKRRGNCVYPDVPNVYTSVSSYLPWIKMILKKAN